MTTTATLFGTIVRVHEPSVLHSPFAFSLADVELKGQSRLYNVADASLRCDEHSPLANRHNAPWVRGRLEYLFGFTHSANGREVTSLMDDLVTTDRLMLNASFIGQTIQNDTLLQLPFICSEIYSEACLIHGQIPDRNADRYFSLFSSLTHAFVSMLLSEDDLVDYDDYAVIHGMRFEYGVRDGIAYNHFPGSQHGTER